MKQRAAEGPSGSKILIAVQAVNLLDGMLMLECIRCGQVISSGMNGARAGSEHIMAG
ncbi:MAG: hypothetical protein II007_12255 [Gammaproteobacteria bacterium]|nr:hypothetical protein [Gammaproteobacteria bacterium]